jgi:hypothetical protein
VIGGIGTLVVTALWAWWFPALRTADNFTWDAAVAAEVATEAESDAAR